MQVDDELDRELAKLGLRRPTREELPSWEYDPILVNAILEIGSRYPAPPKKSGLVEQQRWFMKIHRKMQANQTQGDAPDGGAEDD